MRKKILCFVLFLAMVLSMTGCRKESSKQDEYLIYYLNMDKTKLVSEEWEKKNVEEANGEVLVKKMLEKLQSAPDSSKLRQTIPMNISITSVQLNGGYLYVDFSEEYNLLQPEEEILIRAAIVKTLVQVEGCSLVAFTINSEPLLTHDGTLVGSMTADSFVENPGKQINTTVESTITLYFSNQEGTGLVKETRDVHYSTNVSMEKMIMEQLIEGPKKDKHLQTVPSGTKLISVSVVDGVCYINLSDAFKNQNAEVNEEIVLYSIVNSLTEEKDVTKVQISLNGSTDGKLRYTYDLSKLYERESKYIIEE